MSLDRPGKIYVVGPMALLALSMLVLAVYPASADLPAPPGVPTFIPTDGGQPIDTPHAANDTAAGASDGGIDNGIIMLMVLSLGIILAAAVIFTVFRK
jgi:hypothetical protein